MPRAGYIVLRLVIAIVLLQTLPYKFTAHPDSVYIFSKLGLEPLGRITTGIVELIAAIMLLIPRTIWLGATLIAGVLAGAIFFHLTTIGIEVRGDNGILFYVGLGTFLLNLVVVWVERRQMPFFGKFF